MSRSAIATCVAVALLGLLMVLTGAQAAPATAPVPRTLSVAPAITMQQCTDLTTALGVGAGGGAASAVYGLKSGVLLDAGVTTGRVAGNVAGVGLAAGMGAAVLTGYFLCHPTVEGEPGSYQMSALFTSALLQNLSTFTHVEAGAVENEMSAVNNTQNVLDYLAAYASLDQLGNLSAHGDAAWNPYLDLQASSVGAQLAQFGGMESYSIGQAANGAVHEWSMQSSGNGPYASYVTPLSVVEPDGTIVQLNTTGDTLVGGLPLGDEDLWVQGGSGVQEAGCAYANETISAWSLDSDPSYLGRNATFTQPVCNTPPPQTNSFAGPSGSYYVAGGGIFDGAISAGPTAPSGQPEVVTYVPGYQNVQVTALHIGSTTGKFGNVTVPLIMGGAEKNMDLYLWQLGHNAVQVGQGYLDFIHQAFPNATSASQIPANCLITNPNAFLPPNLNLSAMSAQQITALEWFYLHQLAQNFNTTLQNGTYCGSHLNPPPGTIPILNSALNASGYVYTPPTPVATRETFAKPATWAYQGDLWLAPTIASISVPVNETWEPSHANPLTIWVAAAGQPLWTFNGTFLDHVVGNGTGPNGVTFVGNAAQGTVNATPGYAIYLTSCQISGVSTDNCTIGVHGITTNPPGGPCTLAPYCVAPPPCGSDCGGATFGLPNWLGGFFGWLSGLFGGGLLGSLLGEILGTVILIAVFVIVLYAIYRIVQYATEGHRK